MCVQNCRTFVWGGTGNPVEHEPPDATCSCTCDSSTWADHNILGESSCVPRKAHVVFGWVGLSLAAVGLLHACHQLQRQIKFHNQQMAASIAPAEHCRKHMHITAIINAILCLLYFSLVLLLDDDRLHLSTLVLLVLQITVMVCGFLTVRMWIYTNDRRLMQGSPKTIKISAFLERTSGQRICYLALAAGPVIGTAFALAGRRETAVKVAGVTFILLIGFADVAFWIFGTSLLLAIEVSLINSRRSSIDASAWTASVTASVRALTGPDGDSVGLGSLGGATLATLGSGRGGSAPGGRGKRGPIGGAAGEAAERGRHHLYAARRKVKSAMAICAQFSLQGYALLICSIFTKYGTAAPSVMFGIQMTILPLIWHVINIQLHAGRSKLALLGGVGLLAGRRTGGHGDRTLHARQRRKSSFSVSLLLLSTCGAAHSVAPVERDDEVAAAVAAEEAGTDENAVKNAIEPC